MAKVVHANDEASHEVLVAALRVLVVRDNAHWFARGIEIDYAASGESLEDVQRRFESGLAMTIRAHLQKYRTVSRLLKWAPPAVVEEYENNKASSCIHSVVFCQLDEPDGEFARLGKIPYGRLDYAYQPAALAA
ncbi:MAG: hypothetical protein AB7V26_10260 [Lysobacterales bacterium]